MYEIKNKIEICNLGPVCNFSMDLDGTINIVIGPQASGKSTIGKAIYFCKKIKDYYMDFILEDKNFLKSDLDKLYSCFLKYLGKNFAECFGAIEQMDSFSVNYCYNNDIRSVSITLCPDYVDFFFSGEIEKFLKKSFGEVCEIYKKHRLCIQSQPSRARRKPELRNEIRQHFLEEAKEIFCMEEDVLYIPAGRSLLSVLADQIDTINTSFLDLPMKDFIRQIQAMKVRYKNRLDTAIIENLKAIQEQEKREEAELAKNLMLHYILKADYINTSEGELLLFDEYHWAKLMFGSSGQQESLWILLLLFFIILENKKTFVILEEPEAHLYPVAQKYMMELISLTANSSGSQMFITTHSPYILSSTNLLIQSGIVENNPQVFGEEIIIKRQFRISPKKVRAYKIQEGTSFRCDSIVDEETGMINSLEIDTVSEIINEEAEKLDNLEIKYDL